MQTTSTVTVPREPAASAEPAPARDPFFAKIGAVLVLDRRLTHAARRFIELIYLNAGPRGWCYFDDGDREIADRLGLSERTIRRARRLAVETGYIDAARLPDEHYLTRCAYTVPEFTSRTAAEVASDLGAGGRAWRAAQARRRRTRAAPSMAEEPDEPGSDRTAQSAGSGHGCPDRPDTDVRSPRARDPISDRDRNEDQHDPSSSDRASSAQDDDEPAAAAEPEAGGGPETAATPSEARGGEREHGASEREGEKRCAPRRPADEIAADVWNLGIEPRPDVVASLGALPSDVYHDALDRARGGRTPTYLLRCVETAKATARQREQSRPPAPDPYARVVRREWPPEVLA
jgi:hypothetical protein